MKKCMLSALICSSLFLCGCSIFHHSGESAVNSTSVDPVEESEQGEQEEQPESAAVDEIVQEYTESVESGDVPPDPVWTVDPRCTVDPIVPIETTVVFENGDVPGNIIPYLAEVSDNFFKDIPDDVDFWDQYDLSEYEGVDKKLKGVWYFTFAARYNKTFVNEVGYKHRVGEYVTGSVFAEFSSDGCLMIHMLTAGTNTYVNDGYIDDEMMMSIPWDKIY